MSKEVSEVLKILSHSMAETESSGAILAERFLHNTKGFIAMYGDLGVGKTAFVRGFASVWAPHADVCSPTYAILNEYEGKNGQLCHFDLYRIESEEDLYSCGFYDYEDSLIIAEWCEKIPYALPDSYIRVTISRVDEDSRMIVIEQVGKGKSYENFSS
jgi:tRNA threonylcarbamoyladenosine biosynthesis protein TsaE